MEDGGQTSSQRPTPEGFETWKAYWTAQGMPWRTEPEIDKERKHYLAERRRVNPDIEKGIYPFRDENGSIKLNRADVEWLLATHQFTSPFKGAQTSNLHIRDGLDLQGADLRQADLHRLPLGRMRGGLSSDIWSGATEKEREAAAVHLEGANLQRADLELAALRFAHLEGADLTGAFLTGATLRGAHLGMNTPLSLPSMQHSSSSHPLSAAADLRRVYFDGASTLDAIELGNKSSAFVRLADVQWGDANLATVNWSAVTMLGDELVARQRQAGDGKVKTKAMRLAEFEGAVRANRQLATVLRQQGLNEPADRFSYCAQVLQRQVLRRQRKWGRAIGSGLLDAVAGYGYKPMRSVFTYVLVVLVFAAIYFGLGGTHGQSLSWNEALVVSLTAFHGRGFFATAFQPGDPQAAVAAVEVVLGLLIEITFIATFTQRFFAR